METPSEGDDSVNKLPSASLPQSGPQVLGTNLKRSESGCLVAENLHGMSTAPVLMRRILHHSGANRSSQRQQSRDILDHCSDQRPA
jgi:hypothetical protein